MKINTPAKKSRKKLIIALFVVVLLIATGSYAAFATVNNLWPFADSSQTQNNDTRSSNDSADVSDQTSSEDSDKQSNSADQITGDDPANHIPPKYDTPDNAEQPSGLTGVISHASVRDGTLIIRTTINQLVSSGECTLTLTRSSDGKTVTKKSSVVANPSTSSCDGFNIPATEVGSGNWSIVIDLKSGDKQGRLTGNVST